MKTSILTFSFNIKQVALIVAVAGLLLSASLTPLHTAHAQTTRDSMQAEIDRLTALVEQLVALLAQRGGGNLSPTPGPISGVCPYAWTRNLGLGDKGEDVRKLQQFLNQSPDTRISLFGFGSPGNETTHYGNATANAVARFQAQFRSAIWTLDGSNGQSGNFDSGTRAQANELCSEAPPSVGPVMLIELLDTNSFLDRNNADDPSDDEGKFEIEIEVTALDEDVYIMLGKGDPPLLLIKEASGNSVNGTRTTSMDSTADQEFDGEGNKLFRIDEGETETFTFFMVYDPEYSGKYKTVLTDIPYRTSYFGKTSEFEISGSEFSTDSISISGRTGETENTLKIITSSNDPNATTFEIDDNDSSDLVTVFAFELRNDGDDDVDIEEVVFDFDLFDVKENVVAEDLFADLELRIDGGTSVLNADFTSNGQLAAFVNTGNVVEAGDQIEMELIATFRSVADGVPNGAGFNVSVESIQAQGDNGDFLVEGSAESATHYLRSGGVVIQIDSVDETFRINDEQDVRDDEGVFTIKFDVTAFEQDVYLEDSARRSGTSDLTDGFIYNLRGSDGLDYFGGETTVSITSRADKDGDYFEISEGETEEFTLTVTYDPEAPDFYQLQLFGIAFNMIPDQADTFTRAIPVDDFETGSLFVDDAGSTPTPTPITEDDEQRKEDLKDIANALEEYFEDYNTFRVEDSGWINNAGVSTGQGWFSQSCEGKTGCKYVNSVAFKLAEGGYTDRVIVDPSGVDTNNDRKDQSGYMISIDAPRLGTNRFTVWANLDNPTADDIATQRNCNMSTYDGYNSDTDVFRGSYPESQRMNYCVSGSATARVIVDDYEPPIDIRGDVLGASISNVHTLSDSFSALSDALNHLEQALE